MTSNSFGACDRLTVDDATYQIVRLDRVAGSARLPFSLKVLLENLLRNEDGPLVTAAQIEALAGWDPAAEIQFTPARVLGRDRVRSLAARRQRIGGLPSGGSAFPPAATRATLTHV